MKKRFIVDTEEKKQLVYQLRTLFSAYSQAKLLTAQRRAMYKEAVHVREHLRKKILAYYRDLYNQNYSGYSIVVAMKMQGHEKTSWSFYRTIQNELKKGNND